VPCLSKDVLIVKDPNSIQAQLETKHFIFGPVPDRAVAALLLSSDVSLWRLRGRRPRITGSLQVKKCEKHVFPRMTCGIAVVRVYVAGHRRYEEVAFSLSRLLSLEEEESGRLSNMMLCDGFVHVLPLILILGCIQTALSTFITPLPQAREWCLIDDLPRVESSFP
jgi:hypothetical protein